MLSEVDQYVIRCLNIEAYLRRLYELEPSDRVWTGVFIERIMAICGSQQDPHGALDQFIDTLNSKRSQLVEMPTDSPPTDHSP
jgi:hypothetical protein